MHSYPVIPQEIGVGEDARDLLLPIRRDVDDEPLRCEARGAHDGVGVARQSHVSVADCSLHPLPVDADRRAYEHRLRRRLSR